MKIEVWSDFVCPFCYIGKRRLEKALAQFPHREHVEVVFRSFELDPAAPNDPAEPVVTMLARKYRVSLDEAKRMTDSVAQQGAAEGLLLRFDTAVNANTFDAHRLLKFAATQGLEQAMAEKLFFAHFTASEHIGRRETLLRLAVEVGLKRSEVEQLLQDGDAFAEAVRSDERRARQLGIRGVPFFLINETYSLSGAQPTAVFAAALEQVWGRR
ncbi:MAG: disulfide bond formation protein DsbA [Bacillaceae bacterium G1]|nr:disulfide bond formation protein DsbA [Bacillota bacterium]OJF16484.1 MAG: disulfide bond formation protein DsbA [Bacillaceae bacterium G1]